MAFKKYRLIHLLPVALIGLYFLAFTYPPFQDYPNLLYQGFVFNEYVFHGNSFGGFFHFYHYVPPNAVSSVFLGILDIALDPLIAGKIYLFILGIGLYSGIVRYLRFHSQANPLFISLMAFYLTFNLHFISGYLNFETGLAFMLHAIVHIRKKGYESKIIVMAITMLIVYLCHFLALTLFFFYFVVYFLSKRNRQGLIALALGSLPILVLGLHYLIMRSIPTFPFIEDIRTSFQIINGKFLVFFSPIIPFHQFKWVIEMTILISFLNYTFSICTFILIIFILGKNILKKQYSIEFWFSAISLFLVFGLPLYFGGVLLPGERFVLFCIMNIFVLFTRERFNNRLRKFSLLLLGVLTIVSFAYVIWGTATFNTMIQQATFPDEAIVHPEYKREGTNGFLHFKYYDAIKKKTALPVFSTGLFAFPDSSSLGATNSH
jgi:hypothetical protein